MIHSRRTRFFMVALFFFVSGIKMFAAQPENKIRFDIDPTIIIHDTVVAPGVLLLQIDALNYLGDNGQVAAITLRIEVDTFLIDFIGIQNTTLPGSWLANYNYFLNEISITYTASFGTGFDIDGKLLDLKLEYFGGFPAGLHFKTNSEVSNINLQIIPTIFIDGTINQTTPPEGIVKQDTVVGQFGQSFNMPLMAEGDGYDSVNRMHLRVGYDTLQLEYNSYTESALTGLTVMHTDSILTIDWEDAPIDLTSLDTLLFLNFDFIGNNNTTVSFLPGSKVYNNGVVVASGFEHGFVRANLLVELLNKPDTAGTTYGDGYYFIGDSVTVTAVPDTGFHFLNWTKDSLVVSGDSVYLFIKQPANDTLTANYLPNSYNVTLIADPTVGGEVSGAGFYDYGEPVTVTAAPAEGYSFMYWLDNGEIVSFDLVYTFVMPHQEKELTAIFEIESFIITATPNNPDYGTAEGGGDYDYGDTATLTATPFEGYKFVVWSEEGEAVSYDSVYTFVVNASRNLIANFQYDSDCPGPVGLYADSLAETAATLYWLASGSESEWDLMWGETGFDTTNSGTLVEGLAQTQYRLENLDPGTLYDFYVRAICTDELQSAWSGPHTFATWFVGIADMDEKKQVTIYPNPASRMLNVVFEKNDPAGTKYRIINFVGLVQHEGEFPASGHAVIRLDGLSPGVYVLQLLIQQRMVTKLFVVR
ncbi:MAG: T9SS type A sorting domain-containing protein [Bacteroidales bacterium]|nr:T9SS type A sorting domain-containing protein [Bacteroidales bacterium]